MDGAGVTMDGADATRLVVRALRPRTTKRFETSVRFFYKTVELFDMPMCIAYTASHVLWRVLRILGDDTWRMLDFGWAAAAATQRVLAGLAGASMHPLVSASLGIGLKMHWRAYDDDAGLMSAMYSFPRGSKDKAEADVLRLLDFRTHVPSPHDALMVLERAGAGTPLQRREADELLRSSLTRDACDGVLGADAFCVAIAAFLHVRHRGADGVEFVVEATVLAACVEHHWAARAGFLSETACVYEAMRAFVKPPPPPPPPPSPPCSPRARPTIPTPSTGANSTSAPAVSRDEAPPAFDELGEAPVGCV